MSVYFMFAYTFFAVFEFYYEKTKYVAIATVSGAVLNIVLNYIFIGKLGYYAAGYTTLLCYIVFSLYHYYFMRKICKKEFWGEMPYKTSVLLAITAAFMIGGFSILLLYNNCVGRYLLIGVLVLLMIVFSNKIMNQITRLISLKKQHD